MKLLRGENNGNNPEIGIKGIEGIEAIPTDEEKAVFHCSPASLMNRIPALDTVAGVAFFNEFISKTIRIASLRGTRSLETSVKTWETSMKQACIWKD